VRRPEDGDDTVSEGIGYGMLLAAYLDDRPTFDSLWSYAKLYLDGNGLMHWRIGPDGSIWGHNAAADGDEDMALARVAADRRWGGGYGAEARSLIDKILHYEVEANTYVLKPGDVWGGWNITNPSYFAPAYYKVFAAYTGEERWTAVADRVYQVIAELNNKTGAGATGLLPDWATAAGKPAPEAANKPHQGFAYLYDACRVPWRLAKDAAWYGDGRALAQLARLNAFWASVGVANIRDGYHLDGRVIGQRHNSAFVAPAASGAIVSPDAALRAAMWDETVRRPRLDNYYSDTLRVLGLLFMSGNMPNPLEIGAAPSPTFASSASVSPSTVAAGASAAIDVIVTATGGPLTGGIVDVEVYDALGARVSQQFYTGQDFSPGQARSYSSVWAAPAVAGTYTVKVGVFGAGWSLTYYWNDNAGTIQVVTSPAGGTGSIRQEVWTEVDGTGVSSIPLATPPSLERTLTSLEAPTNWADRYGARIRGYLHPPATGTYTFWIASDDNAELWLSQSDQPGGKRRIAFVSDWTNPHEWNKYASQRSAPVDLVAGQRYYIEVLHKERSGGDNLAVGWIKPGGSGTAPQEIVPGYALSPYSTP
jgi:endo-1,4-beta-D-glucanase Y